MKSLTRFLLAVLLGVILCPTAPARDKRIHAAVDISHYFLDTTRIRFPNLYLKGHGFNTNWGTVTDCDPSNINLLVFLDCFPKAPYSDEEYNFTLEFARSGGTVLILADAGNNPQHDWLKRFGARLAGKSKRPWKPAEPLPPETVIMMGPGPNLKLDKTADWDVVVKDAGNNPVVARKRVGDGFIIAGPQSLVGQGNPIWLTTLLEHCCQSKPVDPSLPIGVREMTDMGNFISMDGLDYHYPDHLKPAFESLAKLHQRCKVMADKVIPAQDPTRHPHYVFPLAASAGLSWLGEYITVTGAWWNGFPKDDLRMTELLLSRMMRARLYDHQEVLYAPLLSYATLQAMAQGGHKRVADIEMTRMIRNARSLDPSMKRSDLIELAQMEDVKRSHPYSRDQTHKTDSYTIYYGKSYALFEDLNRLDDQFLTKYIQLKRTIGAGNAPYTLSDMAAVMSKALNKDVFPLFREYGQKVDPEQVRVVLPE